MNRTEPANRAS